MLLSPTRTQKIWRANECRGHDGNIRHNDNIVKPDCLPTEQSNIVSRLRQSRIATSFVCGGMELEELTRQQRFSQLSFEYVARLLSLLTVLLALDVLQSELMPRKTNG